MYYLYVYAQQNGPNGSENIPCAEGELVEEAGECDSQQDEVSLLKKEIRRLQAKVSVPTVMCVTTKLFLHNVC